MLMFYRMGLKYACTIFYLLKTFAFTTLRRSHCSPHAEGTVTRNHGVGILVTPIDRVGNEVDTAVHYSNIHTTGMVADRRKDSPGIPSG